jgi:hypothetical protein
MLLGRIPGRWFAGLVDYAHGEHGCLKYCLIVIPLADLGTLLTLAYASTPDHVGLPSIYDDSDHDDVVILLTKQQDAGRMLAPARPSCWSSAAMSSN